MIFGGPPSSGKTQAIERTVNEPIQNIISDNDENDFRIKKISFSGLTKYLAEKEQGYVVSSEIYDILTKLLKSDEENATVQNFPPCMKVVPLFFQSTLKKVSMTT